MPRFDGRGALLATIGGMLQHSPARPSPAEVGRYDWLLAEPPAPLSVVMGETLAAPWFGIESIEHGCDYTGAGQHQVYVLRRRSVT